MRHRKSWILSHLLIAGIAVLAVSRAQAATVGVPENLPPFGLAAANPEGQRGIYADLADAIAKNTHDRSNSGSCRTGECCRSSRPGEWTTPSAW